MKSVEIMLMPSFSRTAQDMGYEEGDDIDSDAVLYQQGYDMQSMEVRAGEKFTIDENWEDGHLNCDGETYKLIKKEPWGEKEIIEDDDQIHFERGKYIFHDDGKTFELIEKYGI